MNFKSKNKPNRLRSQFNSELLFFLVSQPLRNLHPVFTNDNRELGGTLTFLQLCVSAITPMHLHDTGRSSKGDRARASIELDGLNKIIII